MPIVLDRTKPYAVICGGLSPALYEQGGNEFRADGSLYIPPQTSADSNTGSADGDVSKTG